MEDKKNTEELVVEIHQMVAELVEKLSPLEEFIPELAKRAKTMARISTFMRGTGVKA